MADILLVEDDATLVLSLEMTLQAHGHHVIVCRRLAEARDILKGGLPDLLLLDLGLPDGDGLDLCQELRQQGAITPFDAHRSGDSGCTSGWVTSRCR